MGSKPFRRKFFHIFGVRKKIRNFRKNRRFFSDFFSSDFFFPKSFPTQPKTEKSAEKIDFYFLAGYTPTQTQQLGRTKNRAHKAPEELKKKQSSPTEKLKEQRGPPAHPARTQAATRNKTAQSHQESPHTQPINETNQSRGTILLYARFRLRPQEINEIFLQLCMDNSSSSKAILFLTFPNSPKKT